LRDGRRDQSVDRRRVGDITDVGAHPRPNSGRGGVDRFADIGHHDASAFGG